VVARRRAGSVLEGSPCGMVLVCEVRSRTVRVGVVPCGKDAGARAGVYQVARGNSCGTVLAMSPAPTSRAEVVAEGVIAPA
jgi:hypothetical protein